VTNKEPIATTQTETPIKTENWVVRRFNMGEFKICSARIYFDADWEICAIAIFIWSKKTTNRQLQSTIKNLKSQL
jgi:hypothetical protein